MAKEDLQIKADSEGVWLSVLSDDISVAAVRSFLRAKGVRNYDEKITENLARRKLPSPQKIASRSERDEKDAVVAAEISKDGMTASVTVEPPFFARPDPGVKEIMEALKLKNVVFGIDEDAVRKLVSLRIFDQTVPVAEGVAPQNGTAAKVELLVDPDREPEVDQNAQRVDHRSRSTVVNVRQGQTIAVREPPTEGKDGTSVTGEPVRAVAGKDAAFRFGDGLEVSEDGLSLVAAIDGCLLKKEGKLIVRPELDIKSDVDFSVGNIDFRGSVKIRGAVREGFRVAATGDVEIKDVVEGATLESAGNIIIMGGVRGMGRARILAGGDVVAGFADQAWIRSRGDVRIRGALFHSTVTAQNSVVVMGGQKSQIAGGKIQAGREIVCETLGSEMGTKTELNVGIPPEQSERRKEVQSLISQNETNLEKLEANLVYLKKQEAAGALDEERRKLLLSATKTKFRIQSALESLQKELQELESRMELSKSQGAVRVKGICYPGVSILIRNSAYVVRGPLRFTAFVYEDGEVRLRSFE